MTSVRSRSTPGTWFVNILLVITSTVATFVVVFLLDILAQRVSRWMAVADVNRNPHIAITEYHHGLAPNRSYTDHWGDVAFQFHTNSLGMRDATVRDVPLKSNKRRILFIGDSFTEGSGVVYEKTFVGRVAAGLADTGTEVLNAGVASYCSIIYWAKTKHLLEKVGLKIDELVVMIDMSDVYDGTTFTLDRHGNVIKRKFLKRVQEFVEQNTLFLRQISEFLYGHYLRMTYWRAKAPGGDSAPQAAKNETAGLAINHHHALWTIRDDLFERYGRAGLANEAQSLDRLAVLLREKGVKMTIAVHPWPDQIWHQDFESRQVSHWREWAKKNGARFVNIFPAFFARDKSEAAAVIRRNYIPGDVHWNENGHALVADTLLKSLRQ